MLSQRRKDKQNCTNPVHPEPLKSGNMLYKALEILKEEKQTILKESQQRDKMYEEDKRKMKLEVESYKKRIAELTETAILNNIVKRDHSDIKKDNQNFLRTRKYELEMDHYKNALSEKEKSIESCKLQLKEMHRKLKLAQQDKQKHLELSLIEKINTQQRNQILEQQIKSKKKIIQGLKKQIDKITKAQMDMGKKQRQIVKRGRQMNQYESQFQSYFSQTQKKYQRRIDNLEQENRFLRRQIKKITKQVKFNCTCQGEAEEWKQKLYQVGRQLARARVELGKFQGKNQQGVTHGKKDKICKKRSPQADSDESIGSLTLSEDDSDRQTQKTIQKGR